MFHTALELEVGLWIVAEPFRVPDRSDGWARSTCGLAAIWARGVPGAPKFTALTGGEGFAAANWGELTVVSVYLPPSKSVTQYQGMLAGVRDCVARQYPRPVLVAGDFNVKALGDQLLATDPRCDVTKQWASMLGLQRIPQGPEMTCVRPQGASCVDHAFANLAAVHRVVARQVLLDAETMSDHRYIRMDISASTGGGPPHPSPQGGRAPRWVLRRLDQGVLQAIGEATQWAWSEPSPDAGEEAERLREDMTRVCDACMPRAGKPPPLREARWWSRDLSELRLECGRLRREIARAHLSGRPVPLTRARYSEKRDELRKAIAAAQTRSWEELLSTLDKDPWGRPYRWVMSKLRPWAPPTVERLDPQFLGMVLDKLFPADAAELAVRTSHGDATSSEQTIWSDDMGVTEEELAWAMKRLGAKCTAPGPDGIPGRVWVLLQDTLGSRLRQLFDSCLKSGRFPPVWKRARLVLLPKEGKPADSPSAYRPICLLDEAGKLFERIVNLRLVDHLSRTGPDLSDAQFGFRAGRSTVDALDHVRSFAENWVSRGCGVLAVSLDIANAFNSLPWDRIRAALEYHRVPPYLRKIVHDYLRDRWVEFVGSDGKLHRRGICRGVPQGSVLGPTLWNLGYNAVLRVTLPVGVSVVCYADDTLIIARGKGWEETTRRAEQGTARVVSKIQSLGLTVAVEKTEVLHFRAPRTRRPRLPGLRIGGSTVEVGDQMKYLGLILDPHWRFVGHFQRLKPRLLGIAGMLRRILPNTEGPRTAVRRLHAGVVRSVASYGAPIWARDVKRARATQAILRQAGRLSASRIARCYKTASADVAHLLAGVPPFSLLADMYAVTYYRKRMLRREMGDTNQLQRAVEAAKRQAWQSMLSEWKHSLAELSQKGQPTVGAILPCFDAWLDSGCGRLTYRLAQVLSGHGCFGNYLCRIGKETTPRCHQCGAARDSVQHTLEECIHFEAQRRELRAVVGPDLSLPGLVRAMLGSEQAWEAASSFCEQVMFVKEEAERVRRPRGGRKVRFVGDPLSDEEGVGGLEPGDGGILLPPLNPPAPTSDPTSSGVG